MAEFYHNLFSINVAFAGIAVASILAVTQLLQFILVFNSAKKLVFDKHLKIFAGLLIIGLLSSATASIILTSPNHNLIPFFDFNSDEIVNSILFAIANLLLLLTTLFYFCFILYRETRYLVPSTAIDFFVKNYNHNDLKKYLKYRYSKAPSPPVVFNLASILGEDTDEDEEEVKMDELNSKYEKELKEYETAREDNESIDSPLAPLESYLIKSLKNSDMGLLIKTLRSFEAIHLKHPGDYSLLNYYTDVIRSAVELSLAQDSGSAIQYLLESLENFCNDLLEKKKVSNLTPLLNLLRDLGEIFNDKHSAGFVKVMSIYRFVGEDLFTIEDDETQEKIDNIAIDVGWLGEKLLVSMDGLEHVPLMHNDRQETKLSALINCLFGLGYKFSSDVGKDKYSRIYLDALYVVARELLELKQTIGVDESDQRSFEENFFTLMHDHQTLFESAVRARNTHNTSIALFKLKDFIKLAKDHDEQKMLNDTVETMLRMGAIAAPYEKELGDVEFSVASKDSYTDRVIEYIRLAGSIDHEALDHEAHEILIKCSHDSEHYKAVKKYLKTVGTALGSSFGMNLD